MTDQHIEQIRSTLRDAMAAVDGLEASQSAMDQRETLLTEPGHYLDRDGDVHSLTKGQFLDERWAPYLRLEPVPVTAKRILAATEAAVGKMPFGHVVALPVLREVLAKEFGVPNE
jgi:hypothetical protein